MIYRWIGKGVVVAAVGLGLVAAASAQAGTTSTGSTGSAASSGNAAKNAFTENSEIFLGVSLVDTHSVQVPTVGQEYSEDSPAGWDLTYRYHASNWVAFDVRFAYSKGTSMLGTWYHVDAYEGEWSADAAITFPTGSFIKPYVMAGPGVLWFGPNAYIGNTPGADGQGRFAYVFGGGVTVNLSHSVGLRAEYRGLYYRIPDFRIGATTLDANMFGDVWTFQSVPTVGLVFHF